MAGKSAEIGDNRKAELLRRIAFFDDVGNVMNIEGKIASAKARVTELNNDRKKAIGLAKSRGHKAETIGFAIAAQTAKDPKAFVDKYVHNGEVLEWCGLFPGFQPDLFADRAPQDERLQKAGELAGLTSRERSSGYAPGSQEDQAWLAAYDAAAKERTEFLAEALEAAAAPSAPAAAKGRGGRPPKVKAGAPLNGETPDSAKAAANDDKPKPPKPPAADEDGLTNSEKEAKRQAEAAFH